MSDAEHIKQLEHYNSFNGANTIEYKRTAEAIAWAKKLSARVKALETGLAWYAECKHIAEKYRDDPDVVAICGDGSHARGLLMQGEKG